MPATKVPALDKSLVRLAVRLAQRQPPYRTPSLNLGGLESAWADLRNCVQRVEMCQQRGWPHAASSAVNDLRYSAIVLSQGVENLLAPLAPTSKPSPIASTAELYRDLVGLKEEFENLEYDLEQGDIVVTTEPIELDDMPFGRFAIRLRWPPPAEGTAYRIEALDPHPAAANDSVTHPHVQYELLCEGEGKTPIRKALAEGRLYDFFLLVNRILHTYAAGSAFVELDSWTGIRCHDCDYLTTDHDRSYCDRCDSVLCSECGSHCGACGNGVCSDCQRMCASCREVFCESCLEICERCRERVCENCLRDGGCAECTNQIKEDHESNTKSEFDHGAAGATASGPAPKGAAASPRAPQRTPAKIHAHGLGETRVSA